MPWRRRAGFAADIRQLLRAAAPPPLELPLRLLAAAGVVIGFALAIAEWNDLPARIPSHFGADGRPDAYGPRSTLLWLPLLSLALLVGLSLLARRPEHFNYPVALTPENAARQARLARELVAMLQAGVVWLFVVMQWRIVAVARGGEGGLGAWFLPLFLALSFAPAIIYLVRALRAR